MHKKLKMCLALGDQGAFAMVTPEHPWDQRP